MNLNQAEFAGKLGFSRLATISDYETDKRAPDIATLRKIAYMGSVSLDWLLTGQGRLSLLDPGWVGSVKDGSVVYGGGDFIKVNIYDPATAGPPREFPATDPIGSIMVPSADCAPGTAAVKVLGDGMRPSILDGTVAGVHTGDKRVTSGNIYAVWLDFEGITLKRLFAYPDRIVLKPDNPAFPETAVYNGNSKKEFIIGRVAWVYQRY
ncbi:MAG: helix-turn-helix domain-containing protein [Deltaproteobacteria bacterium]|nr:helix-turn-helix domain-containing protein [Deltaproteobacteria bacterium]MBZ0219961.1 XRE family transcriptional regulator [Deltaproteobacteria bacterium]